MLEPYRQHCNALQRTGNYRQLPVSPDDSCLEWLNFSSNDYLQLSKNPQVIQAGVDALLMHGTGATGARLLSGNLSVYQAFESDIAKFKKTPAALLFNSGYQANVSVLAALLNQRILKVKPLVFFDKLNHASLYQGIFLSGAELVRYRHLDYDHLLQLLKQYALDERPKWIITETLFGMDGDVVDLAKILNLAKQFSTCVYLDEAHAVGVLGASGYGLSTDFSHEPHIVVMGTLSKALGCSGAYLAADQAIIDYCINQATGFMYSTALSPSIIAAAHVAWQQVQCLQKQRQALLAQAYHFRETLRAAGFQVGQTTSHIIPLMMNGYETMYRTYQRLLDHQIKVSLIRKPTVPPGGERLRLALQVGHTETALTRLMCALKG